MPARYEAPIVRVGELSEVSYIWGGMDVCREVVADLVEEVRHHGAGVVTDSQSSTLWSMKSIGPVGGGAGVGRGSVGKNFGSARVYLCPFCCGAVVAEVVLVLALGAVAVAALEVVERWC